MGLLAAGYSGFNEGNFLSLLNTVSRQIDRHFQVFGSTDPRVLTSRVNPARLKQTFFDAVKEVVEAQHVGQSWIDKTGNPEMIQAIPILRSLWPTSRFIFAKRRAIENVISRLKKFPDHNFDYHCADWARNMTAWRELKERDPTLPGIEIDQRDISSDPVGTAARLASFLELPPEAAQGMERVFARDRPQETRPGSADRVLALGETGWNQRQLEIFETRCGAEMHAFGYTTDATYRVPSPDELLESLQQSGA